MSYKFHKVDVMVNVCGLVCPEPMIVVIRNLRYMDKGGIILVIADDPSIKRDILLLCHFMKHILIMKITKYIPYCYLLQKRL